MASQIGGYKLAIVIKPADEKTAETLLLSTPTVPESPFKYLRGQSRRNLCVSPKFTSPLSKGFLSAFSQVHFLGRDISYIPPTLPPTAPCPTSTSILVFPSVLGYEVKSVQLCRGLRGREVALGEGLKMTVLRSESQGKFTKVLSYGIGMRQRHRDLR